MGRVPERCILPRWGRYLKGKSRFIKSVGPKAEAIVGHVCSALFPHPFSTEEAHSDAYTHTHGMIQEQEDLAVSSYMWTPPPPPRSHLGCVCNCPTLGS